MRRMACQAFCVCVCVRGLLQGGLEEFPELERHEMSKVLEVKLLWRSGRAVETVG